MSTDPFSQRPAGAPVQIALGCMNFGKRTPEPEARRIIDRALERGITVFDTANAYVDGESERILGRAVHGVRDRVQIATKVGFGRSGGKPEGLSPEVIRRELAGSLERLGTDRVDLYYLHVPDHQTPIEASLATMEELREEGKIRALGVSNYAAWQILDMMGIAATGEGPWPAVSQVMYNLLIREVEIEYAAFTRKHPIHTTVYNPLAGGLLSGKHAGAESSPHDGAASGPKRRAPSEPPKGSRFDKNKFYQDRYWTPRFFEQVATLGQIAKDAGMSLLELSYAWIAAQPFVDSILVGPATVEHLDAALDAVEKEVPPEIRARIDEAHRTYRGTNASWVR